MRRTDANGRSLVQINRGPNWLRGDGIAEMPHRLIGRGRRLTVVDVRSGGPLIGRIHLPFRVKTRDVLFVVSAHHRDDILPGSVLARDKLLSSTWRNRISQLVPAIRARSLLKSIPGPSAIRSSGGSLLGGRFYRFRRHSCCETRAE